MPLDPNVSPVDWYIGGYLLRFVELEDPCSEDHEAKFLTWENTVIVMATSLDEAHDKIARIGKQATAPYKGGPAAVDVRWLFEGVTFLVPVYEELRDGAEVIWAEHSPRKLRNIRRMVAPKGSFRQRRRDAYPFGRREAQRRATKPPAGFDYHPSGGLGATPPAPRYLEGEAPQYTLAGTEHEHPSPSLALVLLGRAGRHRRRRVRRLYARGQVDRILEAGLLFDLAVLVPALYWLCYRKKRERIFSRVAALACLGIWLASKLVPEADRDLLNYVAPLRYAGLVVLIALELAVMLAIYRTLFSGGTVEEAVSKAPADMPSWAVKLMAMEARFWRKVWSAIRRLTGRP